ncbi:MFS transporter [Priestia megaterium]|uniref:MFS transporter n=1 Tax=Priestia megaterium TaxID=1404 RepID=UPI000BF9D793|nr:MFS transporter [Priestia megaterium]MEB2293166.1 MFS transporter [Priestia megaterium]PEZ09916.1 MFS transporter [Priestia megaterium]PGK30418.1 MFS transporter [Priestia megaterium]
MKNRSVLFLWFGQSQANLADVLYIVALISILYAQNSSPVLLSCIPFTITTAKFLSSFTVPFLIDRYRAKRILVVSQLLKTSVLSMFFLWHMSLISMLCCVSLIAFFDGWAAPVQSSMLPHLVDKEKLLKWNSMFNVTDQTIQIAAYPLGSFLIISWDATGLLWLSFSLFSLSIVFMQAIRINAHSSKTKQKQGLKEGWKLIWHYPRLRVLLVMEVLEGMAAGVWASAIVYVFVKEILNKNEAWWGYINSSFFVGTVLGGFVLLKISVEQEKSLYHIVTLGSLLSGFFTLLFGVMPAPFLSLLLSFAIGIALQVSATCSYTLTQTAVPLEKLSKVLSATLSVSYVTFGLSVLLLGAVASLNVTAAFLTAGGLIVISGCVGLFLRNYALAN